MNAFDNNIFVLKKRLPIVIPILVFFGLTFFINANCFGKANDFIPGQMPLENFNLHIGKTTIRPAFAFLIQSSEDFCRDNIKFFSFVSTDSKPVSDKQPNKKSNGAKVERVFSYEFFNEHKVYFIMILTFFAGVILGGGFTN